MPAFFDPHGNFAYTTVATAPSPATSGTSLIVAAGTGGTFPATPFNAVLCPPGVLSLTSDAEIVRVTSISSDTFTILRSQESSSAQTVTAGWQIFAAVTKKTFTDIENAVGYALQPGVMQSADLAITGLSINGSTGAIQFTLAGNSMPVWISFSNGVLVPAFVTGGAQSLLPSTLPSVGQHGICQIEIASGGTVFVAGAFSRASGTIATFTPTTPIYGGGTNLIADVGIYNNSGTYQFSDGSTSPAQGANWFDRRSWAQGAFVSQTKTNGTVTSTSNTMAAIDAATLQARVECTGAPVVCTLLAIGLNLTTNDSVATNLRIDGALVAAAGDLAVYTSVNAGGAGNVGFTWVASPGAGSHLFTPMFSCPGGAGTAEITGTAGLPTQFSVQELLTGSSNGVI